MEPKEQCGSVCRPTGEPCVLSDGHDGCHQAAPSIPSTCATVWVESKVTGAASHAQNPTILRRARDFYAVYCASSDGKNYQGLPCPAWDALTAAVRGHWYTVALRSLQLEAVADPQGVAAGITSLGSEAAAPNNYVLGHLGDPNHALEVWSTYSGHD